MLLLVSTAHPGRAQHYVTRTYTEQQGLPSSTVYGVEQDAHGRVWFLTRAGVTIYDGTIWSPPEAEELSRNWQFTEMTLDARGDAWLAAGFPSFSLVRLHDGKATEIPPPADPPPPSGFGFDGYRLAVVDGPTGPQAIVGSDRSGLLLWDGQAWRRYTREEGLPSDQVTALAERGKRCLVGTADGLAELVDGKVVPRPELLASAPSRRVLALAVEVDPDHDVRTWVVGPDWLGWIQGGRFELVRRDLDLALETPFDQPVAEPDGLGGLYFGSTLSLYHLDGRTGEVEPLGRENGLAGEGATDLMLDREGNLWVTTLRGVSRVAHREVVSWRAAQGLFGDEVTAILLDEDGEGDGMVLGHQEGLTFFDHGSMRTLDLSRRELPELRTGRVFDLEHAGGGLWAAAARYGVAWIGTGGKVRWLDRAFDAAASFTAVCRDAAGRLWVGSDQGVSVIDHPEVVRRGGTPEPRPIRDGPLAGVGVRRIQRDPGGTLYFATFGRGLVAYRDGKWSRWANDDSEPSNDVYGAVRQGGRLWVGTAIGLLVATDDGRLERPPEPALKIERPVYLLLTDTGGRLWIGTDYGIFRWDRRHAVHFTGADGLAGNEVNRAAGAADRQGRVWIGTDSGLTRFDARVEPDRVPPPRPTLLEVEVDGAPRPLPASSTEPIVVGPGERNLVFRLSAPSFLDEDRVHYRTRLDGFDDDWVETTGGTRMASRYRALPSGTYRLLVQARSDASGWSATMQSPAIRVVPPVWRRGWFLALAVALVAALAYGVSREIAQRRYAHTLEREVERRTAELVRSQKLESLGVLAGGIAHDFNNILTVVAGYVSLVRTSPDLSPADAEQLGQAERALGRAKELTGRLLTFARGGAPVTGPVAVAELVRESVEFAARGSTVVCRFDLPTGLWSIEADAGQLSQVLSNLTLNAVQALSSGGTVTVRADNLELRSRRGVELAAGRYVHLVITDDGPGIEPDDLPRIFDPFFTTKKNGSGLGLATAYSIIKSHGGTVTVDSWPNGGARFDLYLPASAEEAVPAPESEGNGPRPGSGRILVMDDEAPVRSVLGAMLSHLGYDASVTERGEEAVERWQQARAAGEPFDVVILDLTVPGGMGGVETIGHLRAVDPQVVCVATSGYAHDPVLSSPEDFGFRAVLPKPFQLATLSDVLGSLLS